MPTVEFDSILEEYYEIVKKDYPDMTRTQLEKICKAPFWFFNRAMGRPDLPTVVITGLGKFRVVSTRVRKLIRETEFKHRCKNIDDEEFDKRMAHLTELLIKVEEEEAKSKRFIKNTDGTHTSTKQEMIIIKE